MNPTLSIIIPSYNYAPFLSECIESILKQSYSDYELIIIDDGSTDDSPKILADYSARYPHIRPIFLPKNVGLFKAIGYANPLIRGRYLHYFSADDRYLPNFLDEMMGFAKRHPEVSLLCSDMSYFQNEIDTPTSTIRAFAFQKPLYIPREAFLSLVREETLKRAGFGLPALSCIFKRELLGRYEWLDPKLENISDWFFFLDVALSEGIGYIPQVLVSMRQHKNTYTSQVKRDKKRRRATYDHLLEKLKERSFVRDRFIKAGLLDFIFKELYWHLLTHPRYHPYWPALLTYRFKTIH